MNNAATQTPETSTRVTLPVRLAWTMGAMGRRTCIAGERGSFGDAGWGNIENLTPEKRERLMQTYPQARMPCWARIERGEV